MARRPQLYRPGPKASPRPRPPRAWAGARAGAASERVRLLAAERSARDRVERLQHVTAALSRAATPAAIGEVVVHEGLRALGADVAVLFLASREAGGLALLAQDGLPEQILPAIRVIAFDSPAPTALAFRGGQPVFVETAEEYERLYPQSAATIRRAAGTTAFAAVPLVGRSGERLGVATVGYRLARAFPPADRAFLLALVELCAQALERARLFEAERQMRAAAEEASRLKDEFIATVSHEIRTPLTAILGWTAMLRGERSEDPVALRKALEVIDRNARAQARVIDDILDVSRIVTGKLRLDPAPVDLGALVREAVESVRLAATAKGLALAVRADAGPHELVGDPGRLRQIAWNLLSNAVRFTAPGGRVQVGLRREGGGLELRVEDSGRGIDPVFLPHVWERFRQQDGSTTRAHGGLGLGLAIVRHLVELHGGSARAESAGLGRGATFVVSLPSAGAAPTPAPPTGGPTPSPPAPPGEGPAPDAAAPAAPGRGASAGGAADGALEGVRVLVVDDEHDTRDLLEAIFSFSGAIVRAASSTAEALRELDVFRPDVLVADIGLPGEDGYTLLRAVRALPGERGRVPAIAVTAYARAEDAARSHEAGYLHHVNKPAEPAALVEAVRSALGRATPG